MGLPLLTFGVALWWVAHLFKRVAPAARQAMSARTAETARGVFAVAILLAIVFMVIGYRNAEPDWFWAPQPWMMHLNNLAVLVAFYIFGIGMAKGGLSQKVRHPMLIGTLIWALAHLMVRGHLAGLILFGGLALWSVVAMLLINAQDRVWTPPARKPGPRDLVAAGIVLVVYVIAGLIHGWIGPSPFGAS